MAKQSYKIPADLNQSYGDMEIAIQSKDGLGAKPLPIAVILTYISSIILCFYVCSQTVIKHGNVFQIVFFVIMWIGMTLLLARYDKTKRMQLQALPTLFNYIPRVNRIVATRKSAKAGGFYSIAGFMIDERTGLVTYPDGTFGYWYTVVGSASILLFDDDRTAILNRVDAFYRKLNTDAEICFVTSKESQKVYRQIASLKRRYDALEAQDPDLLLIADEQFAILRDFVGGSFKSIHQYMILKGDNREALNQLKNIVQSEVENSSLMIKQCTPLYKDDINNVLRVIYKGVE